MRSRLLLIVLLFLTPVTASVADERPTLLVMGDSLSAAYGMPTDQGWVALLESRLVEQGRDFRVLNASISGETTRGGLTRLPRLLERHEPEWVILSLGGNDGLRRIPLEEMSRNLREMIDLSQDAGAQVLLVGIQVPPNLGRHFTERFHRIYHDLAAEHDLPLVPFLLEGVALEEGMMQSDGIHPTASAQPVMLDTVWKVLGPELDG
ncbi:MULTISPECIES: arylesterase [Ectothiorhodospira]|uniref:arylesterase n=1 Tax=Ectothiorhodospira TaxID=1051 RepID=UPI001EE83DF5|nr:MULTISPECIES: arylesterase [Ectothiorhodospira]MCG5493775.1 arylesterase [Ectothiorhodospira variabilis]MCG5497866.1 arylesterase [Ectothiorhodospira variabilis]MCG5503974.1 arylesterase [Ectothiorhodospira variabilis]MCG5507129.1 arylesterase [Ectothiorhodospira variabilis]MCG5524875.1 arylesterase [Ectothiorhodospira haloalkaliphila]